MLAALVAVQGGPLAAQTLKPVTLGLPWTPQAEHCGFYEALDEGLYAKRGLDVVLQPGGPEVNNGLLLASGRLDFALIDMLGVMRLAQGGVPVVATAAYFQKDPQTLVAHPDDGVTSLADLKGHPTLISNNERDSFWRWLKAKYHYDDSQLRPYSFTSAAFVADPHAVQQGYITNDAFVLGKAVPGAKSLLLADAGYPNYANVVMTMRATAVAEPDVVQALVDASTEGWRACLAGNFAGARKRVLAAAPSTPPALFDFSMREMVDAGLLGSASEIGSMSDTRWSDMYQSMQAVGALPAGLDYKAAYTLKFVAPR